MKRQNPILFGKYGAALAVIIMVVVLLGSASCYANSNAFLLQQTPAQGGVVTPGVGVHYIDQNSEITLTARPKPGYRFVYWMGDVADPTAHTTVSYSDRPKIIIAVFERNVYESLAASEMSISAPMGGLKNGSADFYMGRGISGGGRRRPRKWSPPPPPPQSDPFPVPEDGGDEFPVPEPIPEPVTGVLLALGSWFVIAKRKKK